MVARNPRAKVLQDIWLSSGVHLGVFLNFTGFQSQESLAQKDVPKFSC